MTGLELGASRSAPALACELVGLRLDGTVIRMELVHRTTDSGRAEGSDCLLQNKRSRERCDVGRPVGGGHVQNLARACPFTDDGIGAASTWHSDYVTPDVGSAASAVGGLLSGLGRLL